MKNFKDFKKESYSRLDENWLVRMGLGGLGWQGGSRLYDAGTKKSNKGLNNPKSWDGKDRKGNTVVKTGVELGTSTAAANADRIVRGTWNLGKKAVGGTLRLIGGGIVNSLRNKV